LFVALVVALLSMGGALAQAPCQVANDFTGASQTFPGDYSITVVPGSTGTLSALCPAGVSSYFWTPGQQQTPSITVTAPTTGSQTYTMTGCDLTFPTDPFCYPPVSVTLVVNPQAPDCTLAASPNPATSGQTVQFTATCNPAAQQIVYTDLSGTTKVSPSLTFTDTAPAVTSPTERAVFYHGVSTAGGVGIEKSITVTINPVATVQPPANCTLSANPNPVALGASFTLTAACAAGGAVQTFAFSGPSGPIGSPSASSTATVTATAVGTQTYTVRASNAGGQATATTSVTVAAVAPSGCTLNASPNPVFVGQQIVLSAQCSGGGVPTTYTFTLPDGHTVTQATGTLVTVGPAAGAATYSVVAANASGSAPPAAATVTVQPTGCTITPSVPNPVPRGTSLTLTANCTPPVSSYSWTAGGSPIAQTGQTITVTPTATTAYAVAGTTLVSDTPLTVTGQYTVVVTSAASIANIVGTTITGVPGRPLARTLDVQVSDTSGQPVAGEFVTWTIVNPGPNPGAFGQTSTGPTSAQGVASNTFTMGTDPGGRILRACLASRPSVCADFTIVPGGSQIAALPGSPLVGAPGQALRELAVQVRDPAGNPVAGESVAWSVVNPGPNPGTFALPTTGPTDAQGVTRNTFTMGSDPNGRTLRACLVSAPAICADFVVRSLSAVVERPATKIMSPIAETATETALIQMQNVRFRLDQLRLRRNPAVLEALRVSVAGKSLPPWSAFAIQSKDGKPPKGGGAAADADPFERFGFFINGDVEIGRQSATGVQSGYDLRTRGITAGVDYRLPGESVIGGAVGLMHARTDLADEGGDQSASGYSFNAYGSFVPTANTYLDVILHAGHNKYDTRRRDPSDAGVPVDYTSNTKGRQLAMAVTAGADINRGPLIMNPYLRVDYVDAKVNGFTESGDASAITVRDLNLRTTVVTAGGQLSYTIGTGWGVLVPNTRLELQRRVQGDAHNVTAALVADGTITSQTQLQSVDRNFGNVSVGASAVFPRGVNGFVNVERLFGRESYSNTKYTLGVRVEF
jgi:outer membrane autotransporter protein